MKFGNHFPENKAFGWHGKFGQTENIFSLTENWAKNDWNHFQSLFSEKPFPPLSHTHSSLTHALPLSKLHCFDPHTEPNGTIHTDAPRSRSRWSPKLRRSTSITIAIAISPIGVDCDHRNRRDCDCDRDRVDRDRADRDCNLGAIYDLFWVLFEFLGMNDIICLFGSWENVRKYEQQVENVFSMVFSRIQPNIRKCFPKIFLKCNQTHENIFFSRK